MSARVEHPGAPDGGVAPRVAALDCIEWYVQCLRHMVEGKPVRCLDEAKAGYEWAINALESL